MFALLLDSRVLHRILLSTLLYFPTIGPWGQHAIVDYRTQ